MLPIAKLCLQPDGNVCVFGAGYMCCTKSVPKFVFKHTGPSSVFQLRQSAPLLVCYPWTCRSKKSSSRLQMSNRCLMPEWSLRGSKQMLCSKIPMSHFRAFWLKLQGNLFNRIYGPVHSLQQLLLDITFLWTCSFCICGSSLKQVDILCPYIKAGMRLCTHDADKLLDDHELCYYRPPQ